MFRFGLIPAICLCSLFCSHALAQNTVVTSAASPFVGLAPDSLATIFGTNLAQSTEVGLQPFPTILAGVGVQVTDSNSVTRDAGLLLVSSTQINFLVPAETLPGPATVTILSNLFRILLPTLITRTAPGLFTVNAAGAAAATAVRFTLPNLIPTSIPVFTCGVLTCQLTPLVLGVDTPIFLTFYGTGIRGRSLLPNLLPNVVVRIGSFDIVPTYAGPQMLVDGLDQVNVQLPLILRGAGQVTVTVTVDRVRSNPVKIFIQ